MPPNPLSGSLQSVPVAPGRRILPRLFQTYVASSAPWRRQPSAVAPAQARCNERRSLLLLASLLVGAAIRTTRRISAERPPAVFAAAFCAEFAVPAGLTALAKDAADHPLPLKVLFRSCQSCIPAPQRSAPPTTGAERPRKCPESLEVHDMVRPWSPFATGSVGLLLAAFPHVVAHVLAPLGKLALALFRREGELPLSLAGAAACFLALPVPGVGGVALPVSLALLGTSVGVLVSHSGPAVRADIRGACAVGPWPGRLVPAAPAGRLQWSSRVPVPPASLTHVIPHSVSMPLACFWGPLRLSPPHPLPADRTHIRRAAGARTGWARGPSALPARPRLLAGGVHSVNFTCGGEPGETCLCRPALAELRLRCHAGTHPGGSTDRRGPWLPPAAGARPLTLPALLPPVRCPLRVPGDRATCGSPRLQIDASLAA